MKATEVPGGGTQFIVLPRSGTPKGLEVGAASLGSVTPGTWNLRRGKTRSRGPEAKVWGSRFKLRQSSQRKGQSLEG